MDNFNKENGKLINIRENNKVNKFSFDGEYYYYTIVNERIIIKCTLELDVVEMYGTVDIYDNICYDSEKERFLVNIVNDNSKIIELDKKMREIRDIELENMESKITGISYNCSERNIVVSLEKRIFELIEGKECKYRNIYYTENDNIMSVLSVSPYYFVAVSTSIGQKIYLVNKVGKVENSFDVECSIRVKNIVFNPRDEYGICASLDYLAVNNRYEYMCSKAICGFCIDEKIDKCNYNICDICPDEDVRPFRACKDIIESIAIIETSLGYILYQESEKLRKILENSDDIDEILEVNREINKTIVNVTNLEHILYNKLIAVLDKCSIC